MEDSFAIKKEEQEIKNEINQTDNETAGLSYRQTGEALNIPYTTVADYVRAVWSPTGSEKARWFNQP